MARLVNASDRAVLVEFDDTTGADSGRAVLRLHAWLRDEPLAAVVDLHPAYATLLIRYDPLRCDPNELLREIERRSSLLSERPERKGGTFEIAVRYGGRDGPDLGAVARCAGLSEEEVIATHAGAVYEVRFLGFMPGFPYLSGLPERLRAPRRDEPRTDVPAGSVAIAGSQAGIYPARSPGGWNIIGRTEFVLFDASQDAGATLAPGDVLRFRAVRDGR